MKLNWILSIRPGLLLLPLAIACILAPLVHSAAENEETRPVIKVAVDLVPLSISVTDHKGRIVSGLQKRDFRIYEDDIEQVVNSFDVQSTPVSWEILLDRSASMEGMIGEVRAVGRRLLEQLPLSEDIDLIPFNDGVERVSSFHSGRDLLEHKVDSLKAVGETALYDSLAAALEGPPTEHHDRKVIVLVTDGLDDNSRIHFQEMVDRVELKNDTTIYAVGMFDYARRPWWDRARSPEDERIERNLTRLAEISGGAAYFPKNQDEGRKAIDAIIRNVRGQYSLSFYRRPHGDSRSSSDVRVEVRPGGRNTPGLTVRSRRAFSSPGPLAGLPEN